MSNVIKLRPDLKTFTIKVFYDHDGMEVERIELQKRKFGRLNKLIKSDLLKDVLDLLKQERKKCFYGYIEDTIETISFFKDMKEADNPDFEKYAGRYGKSVKEWKTDRQKDLAKRKKAPKSPNAKVVRFRCKNK